MNSRRSEVSSETALNRLLSASGATWPQWVRAHRILAEANVQMYAELARRYREEEEAMGK